MPIPEFPRTVYASNPIEMVVCQLRFAPILKIAVEEPVAFQERLRSQFPNYRSTTDVAFGPILSAEVVAKLQEMGVASSLPLPSKTHEFVSEDENEVITLGRESVALTVKRYSRWEEFRARLNLAFDAVCEIYDIKGLTRIGLRYQDVIRRSKIGLTGIGWNELLSPHMLGEYASSDLGSDVVETVRQTVLTLGEKAGFVRMVHGNSRVPPNNEEVYYIDCDFFIEAKTENANALSTLDRFNRNSGRLFRWCISDRLHTALGPKAIAAS